MSATATRTNASGSRSSCRRRGTCGARCRRSTTSRSNGSWAARRSGSSTSPTSSRSRLGPVVDLRVNGGTYRVDPPVGRTLAETLRLDLGLTGTKVACGEGHCGACTVQLDGVPVYSCITLVHLVDGRPVTTIEGLHDHPLVE